ncbi:MAG: DegT/DnrJ/EryC1/StrS aminotransferase family protein [Spirochaeta sp.]|nr:DegT/DnrJ/EryC1/StrS aminotransferase family protein [Spirochaeta sp.]
MTTIPFARPSIGEAEIDAVARVLRSGWLTTGSEAQAFEREFGAFIGAPHALAVNSATAGLHLALEATGTRPGDVVIVPSMTFTATAEVARYLGAEIAFADITADGMLIDPVDVERVAAATVAGGGRVSAIIAVHLAGEVADMKALRDVARRYDAVLVEDAAHAFPSRTAAGYAGTLGDVGVFSFYANKTITTGEGGMLVTADAAIAERVRTMRLHGIDREAWDRYSDPRGRWQYDVVEAGFKYNMTDIAAAIGRVQLRRADSLLAARRDAAERYRESLLPLERENQVTLPRDQEGHAWHLFILRLAGGHRDRDDLAAALQDAGIGVSVHYTPLHRMTYWANRYPAATAALPHTDRRFGEILSLPLYPDISPAEQHTVADTVVRVIRDGIREGVK